MRVIDRGGWRDGDGRTALCRDDHSFLLLVREGIHATLDDSLYPIAHHAIDGGGETVSVLALLRSPVPPIRNRSTTGTDLALPVPVHLGRIEEASLVLKRGDEGLADVGLVCGSYRGQNRGDGRVGGGVSSTRFLLVLSSI